MGQKHSSSKLRNVPCVKDTCKGILLGPEHPIVIQGVRAQATKRCEDPIEVLWILKTHESWYTPPTWWKMDIWYRSKAWTWQNGSIVLPNNVQNNHPLCLPPRFTKFDRHVYQFQTYKKGSWSTTLQPTEVYHFELNVNWMSIFCQGSYYTKTPPLGLIQSIWNLHNL